MNQSLADIEDWLSDLKGQTVRIHKGELATGSEEKIVDIDRVNMELQGITIRGTDQHDIDGYVEGKELILHGEGTIRGKSNESDVELPLGAYEIPFGSELMAFRDEKGLNIETEKALYKIRVH
ncbi:hypothetical protein KO561_00150 [Radiobacillus kanasensis]|uniref:hypothetical protein n=1 Tax=Radiobacillus kanasensis TaxID=2844358 RepID=UPI001E3A6EE9|nr:hypothetical protein [Radiobacillus kanasensis]UFT99454.1 hypothetical protein KO561_00150 [Radiobacillus kanasensis]